MKKSVFDLSNLISFFVMAPIFLVMIYLATASSTTDMKEGLSLFSVAIILVVWAFINSLFGYRINNENKKISYPIMFGLWRKTLRYEDIDCYEIEGFDVNSSVHAGYGFRKFIITLHTNDESHKLIFDSDNTAFKVFVVLKELIPNMECKIKHKNA